MATTGSTGIDTLKRGWLIKQGGRVKTWKRRYFVLDSSGRLTYYTTDADAEQGTNRLGVINIKKALYVTPRSKETKDASTWPPAVPAEACFTIITNDRNYGIYGENEGDAQRWVKTLQAVRGGVDNAEITALVEETQTDRRDSSASRSSEGEQVRRRYHITDAIPHKVQLMFGKWHAVLLKSLGALAAHFGCDDFSLTCDMGKMYQQAPRAIRNRLGELVFGDYVDELRHNICKDFGSDPIAKKAFLSATAKRRIDFSITDEAKGAAFADVRATDGVLFVSVTSDMLGKGVHMTGKDFACTLIMQHDEPVCGGLLQGLPLSDAINVIQARPTLEATLLRLKRALPGEKKVDFDCDYRALHAAARLASCLDLCPQLGDTVICKILPQVVASVMEKLGSASDETKTYILGDSNDLRVVFKLDSNEKADAAVSFASSGTQLVISIGLEKMREIVQYDRSPRFDLEELLKETADSV